MVSWSGEEGAGAAKWLREVRFGVERSLRVMMLEECCAVKVLPGLRFVEVRGR